MSADHDAVEIAVCVNTGDEPDDWAGGPINYALCGQDVYDPEAEAFVTDRMLYTQVWTLGEIVFLNQWGRDVVTSRKPSKWLAEFEYFKLTELDKALACSKRVVASAEEKSA